jgi:hypothetical protein
LRLGLHPVQPAAVTPRLARAVQSGETKIGRPRHGLRFETVPADRGLIDLDDPREVSWWRKRFGCSEEQLRQAVAQVGTKAANVEQLLDGSEIVRL